MAVVHGLRSSFQGHTSPDRAWDVRAETGFHLFAGVQKSLMPTEFQSLHAPLSPQHFRPTSPGVVSPQYAHHRTPPTNLQLPQAARLPATQPTHAYDRREEQPPRPHSAAAPYMRSALDVTPGASGRYDGTTHPVHVVAHYTPARAASPPLPTPPLLHPLAGRRCSGNCHGANPEGVL
jgi:hypothetical protein